MNILFKGVKTGAEIWQIIQHQSLNENDWVKDRLYHFIQYDKVSKNGVNYTESKLIATEEESRLAQEQQRIISLQELISEKKLYDEDYSKEQEELRAIKNGVHDEYINKIKQDAIDDYTLSLIIGGVI
jgi:hypothetical protein